jgi:hypothetical protein
MGKKEKLITSFNPNDFEVVQEPSVKPITEFDPNEFTVVSAPKQPLYKDTFTQVKEAQDAQVEVKKPSPDEVLANVKTNNDSEKELLKNIALKVNEGKATHEELTDAILTIQGQHPKQEGQGSYFVENSGGVYIPRPLKKYEVPKQKNVTKIFSDKSTIETFADSWERGKATLAENLVRTPEFLYDLAVNENINKIPNIYNPLVENYNKVAKKEGLKELPVITKAPTSSELGDITGIHNELADSISREKEKLSRDFQQKYDKGITEYAKNGEYGKAIGLLSNSIIESAPTTIGIALSGGAGATGTAITLAGGAVFGAGKKAELDKEAQGMNETQKLGNAVVTGLAEGFFEQWGITKLGGIVADVFKKEGKDAAKLFAEQAFKKTYAPAVGKYLGITAEEGLGEAATQFAQNAVDKYSGYKPNIKLSDGVADALIVGVGASVAMGAGVAKVESAVEKKIKRANEQSQYLFDTAKKGTEAVNAFKADIDNSVRTGQISKEAADKAKFQLDTYKEYNDQTADLNISDNQKREIFDKTFQKANLEEHIKGLDPEKMNGIELAKYEGLKKQAKHLQEDINKIVLEAQIKEETIAGEKTIEEHEEEPVIKGKEEKKPILSPELQALKDRYKKPETVKEGKLPEQPKPEEDTRTIAEIPNEVWNHSQFNARTKHAKLADYLETVPDKKTSGVLKENVYTYAKKKNRTYEVELPDGKRIRLASSMLRDTGISGHFRTEHIKGKIAEFPVGVKVEYLPDGKKAIKIFNGKTGRFLSWAKATNTSKKDEWTDLQKDQLEHLSTIVEPPIIPPTEEGEGPIEPVKPTEPTKPITPTNVQQINEKTTTGEKTVPATTSEAVEKGERKAKALRAGTKKANRKIRHPELIQALNHDVFEPHGIAMQYFIGGGEIGSQAVKDMFKNAKGELNARISYIRKNGPTIDEIAHNLWEQHSELNFDTQDYANAVEDVVLSYNSSTAMAKDINKQMSEGQDMRFNPLEEVINTEAEIADNNGLGEQFDRAIDFLEGMNDEELIKLANDQEAFNNWYEENENKIEEGKDIIRDDGEGDQFQKPKSKKIIKPKKEEIGGGEKAYEKWKGENKEYEGAEIEEVKTGEKVMLTVYHGTTNEFYEFDSSVKGNIEGHLGKINYFTSDKGDAEMNYTSSGPDLTSRIEQRAERLEYDLEGKTDKEIATEYGVKVKDLKGKSNVEKGRVIAEKELKGGEEKVLKLHVKLNNPVVLGKKSTWVDVIPEAEYADHIPEAEEQIADENGISIEEARQDYSYDIRNRAIENSYTESPLLTALQDALNENGYSDKSASELLQDFLYEEEVDLSNLEKALRKAELYENESGDIASSQVIADFFKNLGYDGIILTDVSERFKNMGIGSYTSHIHVFDEFANQIKLADGTNKTYNEETKDIRFQKQKQDKGSVEVGSHEAVLKVTQHIQKVLPKIKVIYNNKLKAAGKLTADGRTIEINPYYAGSDTPIHEAGHVLIDAMGYGHVAIQAGIKQLKKTDLYKETKERYPELSEEMLNKEVLAEAIGREGADIFDSEVEKSKFKQVLEHIFNWLKQRLGLDKNVAKSLAKQIIGGIGTKKLGGVKGEEQKEIVGQKGIQESRESSEKTSEAVKAFDEANSKRGINRNTAMKEFKKNFPNLAPTIKLVTDNFKEIVNQLKQTHNLIEKC